MNKILPLLLTLIKTLYYPRMKKIYIQIIDLQRGLDELGHIVLNKWKLKVNCSKTKVLYLEVEALKLKNSFFMEIQ